FGSSFKTNAVLLKTINGGENWSKGYLDGVKNVQDLHFFDAQNGIGLFTFHDEFRSRIVLTHNGGANWEKAITPISKILSNFIEVEDKLILSGIDENGILTLFETSNKGQDWNSKQLPASIVSFIYFIDEQTAFAGFGFTNQELSGIYRTTDGGESWKKIDSPMTMHSLIHFHSSTEGFVINHIFTEDQVSWEPNLILQGFEVFQTKDSGDSWQRTEINKECSFIDISHSPSKNLIYTMSGLGLNRFELKQ
ncbi:MAG: WD40/YVTN/BNR-like repeat-containing protein, partial [Chitinophagales bacterium]